MPSTVPSSASPPSARLLFLFSCLLAPKPTSPHWSSFRTHCSPPFPSSPPRRSLLWHNFLLLSVYLHLPLSSTFISFHFPFTSSLLLNYPFLLFTSSLHFISSLFYVIVFSLPFCLSFQFISSLYFFLISLFDSWSPLLPLHPSLPPPPLRPFRQFSSSTHLFLFMQICWCVGVGASVCVHPCVVYVCAYVCVSMCARNLRVWMRIKQNLQRFLQKIGIGIHRIYKIEANIMATADESIKGDKWNTKARILLQVLASTSSVWRPGLIWDTGMKLSGHLYLFIFYWFINLFIQIWYDQ